MARLDPATARSLCRFYCIPISVDFHTLPPATVRNVLRAADSMKYRVPKNANGSRARYFHAYLRRTAERAS
jgi:hypothetical protein